MSLGYIGSCNLIDEDNKRAIYSYAGKNWNDTNSKAGDTDLQDGEFRIYKCCLEEPEIHEKIIKLPSHRKKKIIKRIVHVPHINKHIDDGDIIITKKCKNEFSRCVNEYYIASRLLLNIFEKYQEDGKLPDVVRFIQ